MKKVFAMFEGTTDDQTEKFVDSVRSDTIGNNGVDLETEEGKQKYKRYVSKLNGSGANGTLEDAVKKDESHKFALVDPNMHRYQADQTFKQSRYTGVASPIFTFSGIASSHDTTAATSVGISPQQQQLADMRTAAAACASKCRRSDAEGISARGDWNAKYATSTPYKDRNGAPAPVAMPMSSMNEQGYFTDVNAPLSYQSTNTAVYSNASSRRPSAYERLAAQVAGQTQSPTTGTTVQRPTDTDAASNFLFDPTPTASYNIVSIN